MKDSTRSHATVSELEAYESCPMEYFLKYSRGIPAQSFDAPILSELPGNMLGDLVHAVIREKMKSPERNIAEITDQMARSREIPMHMVPLSDIEVMGARAMAYHAAQKWDDYRMEVSFVMRLGDTLLRGAIDFLGRNTTGWHIVDYKTDHLASKSAAQERAGNYTLQMRAYAAASTQAGITPLLDTTLLFLRTDTAITTPVTEADAATTTETMGCILDGISREDWTVGSAPPCVTCPFHHNQMCWEDRLKSYPA